MKLVDDKIIVVTGGAGFIGSNVVTALNKKGTKNIVIIDDLGHDDKWKNLVGKSFIDLIPINECFKWLNGKELSIEGFIHLGACSSTVEKNCDYLIQNNYRYSQELAEYAIRHALRFVYASSAATYGDGSLGFSDNVAKIETLRPLNGYGYSKQLFDLWLKNQDFFDRVTGIKYFNVFGPNEYHKGRMASAIYHMVPKIQKEGFVSLFKSSEPEKYSDGNQLRDFIYVKDAAEMTIALFDSSAMGLYNIGTGSAETWNNLAKAVFNALQKPVDIRYIDMPEDLIGKYQNFSQADIKRIKGALGNDFSITPLNVAVADYVQNYLLKGEFA